MLAFCTFLGGPKQRGWGTPKTKNSVGPGFFDLWSVHVRACADNMTYNSEKWLYMTFHKLLLILAAHNSSGVSWPPVPGRERPSTNTLIFNWVSKDHSTCFPKHATLSRSYTNLEWQHARPYSVDSRICSLFPLFQVKSQEDWHEARRTWPHEKICVGLSST